MSVAIEAAEASIDAAKKRHMNGLSPTANIRYGDLQQILDDLRCAQQSESKTRAYHFEQNERMTGQLSAMRDALIAVVKALLPPNVTPTQMRGYSDPWPAVAAALWRDIDPAPEMTETP